MDDRGVCYAARDAYYACVDARRRGDTGGPPPAAADAAAPPPPAPYAACSTERAAYEADCRRSWVRYWDDRRRKGLPVRSPTGESGAAR